MGDLPTKNALRDWPLPVRLVLAVFLISVSLGYFSALVQLHFQHAQPGKLLPGPDEAVLAYHGTGQQSQLLRLVTADISKPFNGTGSMRSAFTTRSAGWTLALEDPSLLDGRPPEDRSDMVRLLSSPREDRAWELKKKRRPAEKILADQRRDFFCGAGSMRAAFFRESSGWSSAYPKAVKEGKLEKLMDEREAERIIMLDWFRKAESDDPETKQQFVDAFNDKPYPLTGRLAELPLNADFLDDKTKGAKMRDLFEERCLHCHREGRARAIIGPGRFPLDSFQKIEPYTQRPSKTSNPQPETRTLDEILKEREGERLALVSWIVTGAHRDDYETDRYELTGEMEKHPITDDFVEADGDGKRYAHIQSILKARCVRCHNQDVGGAAGKYPLDSYERIKAYMRPERSGAMSLPKLAQTTHVHLLGFSMLFAITGLIFALTSYPIGLRLIFGPFTLVAQIIDISCWWLGRADPNLARIIAVTGGLVAMGLIVQVVGSLFNMFRGAGKVVVAAVLVAGVALIAVLYFTVISQHLDQESGDQAVVVGKE